MMNDLLKYFLSIIGVGGVVALISYFLIKYFLKKLVDNKFDEMLSVYRNELAKDYERYKFYLNSTFNRISKIHDKEFEVLPIAWVMLQTVYSDLKSFMSPIISPPKDYDSISLDEMKIAIKNSKISSIHKKDLLKESEKYELFKKYSFIISYEPFYIHLKDFREFITKNKIFLDSELFKWFSDIEDHLSDTLLEYQNKNEIDDNIAQLGKIIELQEIIDPIFQKIEKHIQKKLRFIEA